MHYDPATVFRKFVSIPVRLLKKTSSKAARSEDPGAHAFEYVKSPSD